MVVKKKKSTHSSAATSKKPKKSSRLSVYSNLTAKGGKKGTQKAKKDEKARAKAEYLATLPKNPVKRFFYRLHPKRVFAYWFSRRGAIMALKIVGIGLLLGALLVGGLFAYFRKDLEQISPGEIEKRVYSTVNTYYDRNGTLLWEDKGDGNYKLAVSSEDLSDYLKQATIAIEDQDFFKHGGISFTGTIRAALNNLFGGSTQGGSTLTQQLVKQVFFSAEETSDRGWGGVPRKIKELILAIEIERMYNKDEILRLYLNESPYGGRRNGAESGAQTYFGKPAKDLNIAEAALLAAIPQNPSVYDPYNIPGHTALLARQHIVINNMRDQGYITKEEADEAKAYPIIDTIKPQTSQYEGIKAPHFLQMVRSQLEGELGKNVVGRGGLSITTTLDVRIQDKLQEAMSDMFNSYVPAWAGFTNGAATVQDSQTGQIVALVGSRDFMYEGFGQDNAATAYIQPGSTVKSFVYAELFEQKPSGQQNYGSGSILKDENIDDIYRGSLQNADRRYLGDITIRQSLATSRNVPAVKAMYIAGVAPTLETIRELGAASYCTQGSDVQVDLAAAIGGCGVRQVDLVNAYSSLARGGIAKPQSSVLEVKNNVGEVLKKWSDTTGERIISEQSAYIVSDILTDPAARASLSNTPAMNIPGVKTATKTGTSDKGGFAKDLWMMSYSPALTMGVWLGNPDTTILKQGVSSLGSPIIEKVMTFAHKEVYANEGKWTSGDWFSAPRGIQRDGKELYPSWWNKTQGEANVKLSFDRVSKKKATDCTPERARIELDVVKTTDPVTKKDVYINVPSGYNADESDDVHSCVGDGQPTGTFTVSALGSHQYQIATTVTGSGRFTPSSIEIRVNGQLVETTTISGTGSYSYTYTVPSGTANAPVSVTIVDTGYYTGPATGSGTVSY